MYSNFISCSKILLGVCCSTIYLIQCIIPGFILYKYIFLAGTNSAYLPVVNFLSSRFKIGRQLLNPQSKPTETKF